MLKKKAFTLIEVMVVLSVLAIIAILAYNFFGSTMKEARIKSAVTDIRKQVMAIQDAFDLYYMKHGQLPATGANFPSDIIADGILRSDPKLSAAYERTDMACGATTTPSGTGFTAINSNLTGSLTAENDFYMYIKCLSQEICQAYNDTYTTRGVGAALPLNSADVFTDGGSHCEGNGLSNHHYIIMHVLQNN